MYCLVQADRLGAAPAFDAAGKIGDLHTEALSLQVLQLAHSVLGVSGMPKYPGCIVETDIVCVCVYVCVCVLHDCPIWCM